MSRLPRRPTRLRARRVASSVSLLCLAFIALFCLCPLAVKAEEDPRAEYGTVIGIGQCISIAIILYLY
jgi:endoplasmic reticulum chaperone BiP